MSVLALFIHPVAQLVHTCNHTPIIDIDQYCKCTHSTFLTSTFLLMVDKHTDCKVLLIKVVINKSDFSHSAATSRTMTCMFLIHVPVVYGLSWHVHSMMTILNQSCWIPNSGAQNGCRLMRYIYVCIIYIYVYMCVYICMCVCMYTNYIITPNSNTTINEYRLYIGY